MIRKLLVIVLVFAGCLYRSAASDVTTEASTDEVLNSIFSGFSSILTPVWHYATEKVSSYEIYLTSLIFRTEFFFAAVGEHVLPAQAVRTSPDDDMQHHVTAMTAMELMKNLRTMEKINSAVDNVTLEVARNFFKMKSTGEPDHVHEHAMFENMNQKFINDAEFQNIKKKFTQQYLRLSEGNSFHSGRKENANIIMKIQSVAQDPQCQQLKLNTAFLKKSKTRLAMIFDQEEHFKFMLANTLMKLAKNGLYEHRVQKLYNNTIHTVLKTTNPWYMPVEAVNKLFKVLQNGIDDDDVLKKAVSNIRHKIPVSVEDIGKYELDLLF